jgi:hypothetical protein
MVHNINPQRWRDRAREARVNAEQLADPEAKRLMLSVAREYELLGERLERAVKQDNRG